MDGKTPYTIMVSSTFVELADHRRAIRDAMLTQRMLPIAMEDDAALPDQDLIAASLAKVDEADGYVGLIGHRYGQVPFCPERNPEQLSLTELEFRRAVERKMPICMFLMHDNHPIPKRWVQEGRDTNQKLEAFARLVKHDRIYSEFESVDDLRAKAIQSLIRLREVLDARRAAATAVIRNEPAPTSEPTPSAPGPESNAGPQVVEAPKTQSGSGRSDVVTPPTRAKSILFALACLVLSGVCAWIVSRLGGEQGVSRIVVGLFSIGFVFFAAVGILMLRRTAQQGG